MIVIGKVTSNQKLELVRSIRMQNQYNRNEYRERERFLYGYPQTPLYHRGELYSTEMAASLDGQADLVAPKEANLFNGFRIRFLIAVVLLGVFVYMDRTGTPFFGKTMEEIATYLTESIRIEETLNSFDL